MPKKTDAADEAEPTTCEGADDFEQLATEGARLREENARLRDAIEIRSLRKENESLKNIFKRNVASGRAPKDA